MMRTLTNRRGTAVPGATAAGLLGAALLLAVAGVAAGPAQAAVTAAPGPGALPVVPTARTQAATLTGVKARAAAEIAQRQAALSARLTLVTSGSPGLTDADRAALATLLTNDRDGLAALGRTIAADTDLATAKADRQRIFTGYRVYALALPQVRLVRATDALATRALPALTDAQTRLRTALAAAGKTGQGASSMADLQTRIDAIRSTTSGLSEQLLGYTPDRWNADHSLLRPARQSLQSARQDLVKARADLAAVRALLR